MSRKKKWFNQDTQTWLKTGKWKPSCYTTHEPIEIGKGFLLGAACGSPREGYDIYIGLDWGMEFNHQKFPWELNGKDDVIEVQYRITDGCAPKSPKQFKKMITWICSQLQDGKRVHVGCIGGHGRTGLVVAAIVREALGIKDAIKWTRKHHCKKAVETQSQVNFLHKHFGIKKAKGSKSDLFSGIEGTTTGRYYHKEGAGTSVNPKSPVTPLKTVEVVTHMTGQGSIWD